MSKDNYSHDSINIPHEVRKRAERIAALLKLRDWPHAFTIGLYFAERHAEASVIGRTKMLTCTPKLAEIIENNREFIQALCEEGVVEWLTPFVLAKSKQSNHPATDTTQQ